MKSKYLIFGVLLVIIVIFVNGCSQKEKVTSLKEEVHSIIEEENQRWNVSDSLKLCLQNNVYGKEENWVDLAENHCAQLLPDDLLCMFGNTKAGTFGVLCTTSEKISDELKSCQKDKVFGCATDFDCINKSENYCWSYLDNDCKFGPIGVYCLIYS